MKTYQFASFLLLVFCLSSCATTAQLPDPLEAGWLGEDVCKVLEDSKDLRVLKCTFPPNHGHEKHFHAPHWGYALSGSRFRIEDQSGVREVDLKSGSSFSSPQGTDWHQVLNIGDSTAVYLIVEYK